MRYERQAQIERDLWNVFVRSMEVSVDESSGVCDLRLATAVTGRGKIDCCRYENNAVNLNVAVLEQCVIVMPCKTTAWFSGLDCLKTIYCWVFLRFMNTD